MNLRLLVVGLCLVAIGMGQADARMSPALMGGGGGLKAVPVRINGSAYVLAEGDSNTAGQGVVGYPGLYANTTSQSSFALHNAAVSGSKLADLVTREAADCAFIAANPGFANYVLTVLIGTNETSNATYYPSGYAQFGTDYTTYLNAMRACGFTKIVIGTIQNEQFGVQATTNTWLTNMNTVVRALVPSVADAVFDLAANPNLGGPTASLNLTYFQTPGGIHLNNLGELLAETIYARAVNAVTVPAVAPGAPTGLTAGATTTTSVALTWTAPATGGYYTNFSANYALHGSGIYVPFTPGPGRTAAQTITGLTPSPGGTSYDFKVAATGEGGQGAFSSIVTASTSPTVSDVIDTTNIDPAIAVSNANLTATQTSGLWGSVRTQICKSTGKWYAEWKVLSTGENYMPGISDTTGDSSTMAIYVGGFANSAGTLVIGGNRFATGMTVNGFPVITTVTIGDIYGIAFDADNKQAWILWNNTSIIGDPATATSPYITWSGAYTICPALGIQGTAATTYQPTGSQTYSPPTGFSAL